MMNGVHELAESADANLAELHWFSRGNDTVNVAAFLASVAEVSRVLDDHARWNCWSNGIHWDASSGRKFLSCNLQGRLRGCSFRKRSFLHRNFGWCAL